MIARLLVGLVFCQTALAQLQWDKRQLEFHPGVLDTNVAAYFSFSNATTHPIAILSAKASCGSCTTVSLEKKQYLSGETGSVDVAFAFGQRTGLQEKTVLVQTNDLSESAVLLSLKVFIPEFLKITPAFVFWKTGEAKAPKTIALKTTGAPPIHVLGVKSSNPKLVPSLQTLEDGVAYAILVTPSDTSRPVTAVLTITTDFPKESPKMFTAYAMVKPVGWPINR